MTMVFAVMDRRTALYATTIHKPRKGGKGGGREGRKAVYAPLEPGYVGKYISPQEGMGESDVRREGGWEGRGGRRSRSSRVIPHIPLSLPPSLPPSHKAHARQPRRCMPSSRSQGLLFSTRPQANPPTPDLLLFLLLLHHHHHLLLLLPFFPVEGVRGQEQGGGGGGKKGKGGEEGKRGEEGGGARRRRKRRRRTKERGREQRQC